MFSKNTAQSQFSLVKFSKYMIYFFFGTESLAKETKVSNAGVLCIVMLRYLG